MVLCEFRQVLIYVKNDREGDNQYNGKDVCSDEFTDDIPVQPFDVAVWIEPTQMLADTCEMGAKPRRKHGKQLFNMVQ
jgi:hypothetical protein